MFTSSRVLLMWKHLEKQELGSIVAGALGSDLFPRCGISWGRDAGDKHNPGPHFIMKCIIKRSWAPFSGQPSGCQFHSDLFRKQGAHAVLERRLRRRWRSMTHAVYAECSHHPSLISCHWGPVFAYWKSVCSIGSGAENRIGKAFTLDLS